MMSLAWPLFRVTEQAEITPSGAPPMVYITS